MRLKFLYIFIICIIPSLNAHFDNILLIINYNHAHYESIPLLKKIYSPYFKDIVFYGPAQHEEVRQFVHNKGYFSYLCIADAMKKDPHYDGYLFLMDDCIMHPWLMENYDRSTIWCSLMPFHKSNVGNPVNLKKGLKATDWSWWKTQWGFKAVMAAFSQMPKKYKTILEKNWGGSTVVVAFSDMAYISAQYRQPFIELAEIFGKHKVFLEIALPTILSSITLKNSWAWLEGNGTYPIKGSTSLELFNSDVIFNHPIKLSFEEHRLFIDQFFELFVSQ